MLINPSLYDLLENIIFNFQITIDRVHHVQFWSRSDYCISTDIQPEPKFFLDMRLDNVELITHVTLQKILMTVCTDMGKKNFKNTPPKGFFPKSVTHQNLYQKSGSITFVFLWCPNFMKKIRKIQWTVSEISKDG